MSEKVTAHKLYHKRKTHGEIIGLHMNDENFLDRLYLQNLIRDNQDSKWDSVYKNKEY